MVSTEPADDPIPGGEVIQGANPFVGMRPRHMAAAAARWAAAAAVHPLTVTADALRWGAEEARVAAGTSQVAPDPKDKRFADPAWRHPLWRRVAQSYLVSGKSLLGTVDSLGLDPKSAARARFALSQVVEATAPTNSLLGNPAALKRAAATRGRSLVDGSRHLLHDLRRNGGLPSTVDTRPFRVGETVAATRGEVIHRSPLFELIQYQPLTGRVAARPTLVVPPQINRFYFLDLAPGRSFVEHALGAGIQMFVMSWRNPTPDHRDWGIDDYVSACIEAMEVAAEITGSDSVNLTGFCAGGMTQIAALSHLAATGRDLVNAATLAVTLIDTEVSSTLTMFASERTIRSAIATSRRKGVLDGRELARVFAWVRPNDLVWNYWVSNYLLGHNPPAFDVLAWNADATNLPAALHAQFMQMWHDNAFMRPGSLQVLGTPVDPAIIKQDTYVVGALTDHLVPWQSAYQATQVLGGDVRFVLSNSGHIQALVNPPGNPKATFFENPANPPDPAAWLGGAAKVKGSWWGDWSRWTLERSGEQVDAPAAPGDERHPPIVAAPGVYVRQ
ncbi:MAG TPA: alpha/beta fold hydrolase [Acidimicrobiales bacterium]|nr:alpha/beta fold hydrolase [Acidimicrobiales bacterium]